MSLFDSPRPFSAYGSLGGNTSGSGASAAAGGGSAGGGSGFANVRPNPLALATPVFDSYDDPWTSSSSALPSNPYASASPSAAPAFSVPGSASAPSLTGHDGSNTSALASVLTDGSALPPIYRTAWDLACTDPSASTISLTSLNRVLSASGLGAGVVERIVNIATSRSRVRAVEFFVALALVAFAQGGEELDVEVVATRAPHLPSPKLDLSKLNSSTATTSSSPSNLAVRYAPSSLESDPWGSSTNAIGVSVPNGFGADPASVTGITSPGVGIGNVSDPFSAAWRPAEEVSVTLKAETVGFLFGHHVYSIESERRRSAVLRRYSDFVWLLECLTKRYPFRLLPSLPPKRLAISGRHMTADDEFLEKRRRGLLRFLQFLVSHPILREDSLLSTFLTEPSEISVWRKHNPSISLDEESSTKTLDAVQEMSVPADLEEKIAKTRRALEGVVDGWSRACVVFERVIKRKEAAAADYSRFSLSLNTLAEASAQTWRPEGERRVEETLGQVSDAFQNHAGAVESRSRDLMLGTLEALKYQRDLYASFRDLVLRHDRLAPDKVDFLKKRVESSKHRLESLRSPMAASSSGTGSGGGRGAASDATAAEADKLTRSIASDQATIGALLRRRTFVRYAMWNELLVLNWQSRKAEEECKRFVKTEHVWTSKASGVWESLRARLAGFSDD